MDKQTPWPPPQALDDPALPHAHSAASSLDLSDELASSAGASLASMSSSSLLDGDEFLQLKTEPEECLQLCRATVAQVLATLGLKGVGAGGDVTSSGSQGGGNHVEWDVVLGVQEEWLCAEELQSYHEVEAVVEARGMGALTGEEEREGGKEGGREAGRGKEIYVAGVSVMGEDGG